MLCRRTRASSSARSVAFAVLIAAVLIFCVVAEETTSNEGSAHPSSAPPTDNDGQNTATTDSPQGTENTNNEQSEEDSEESEGDGEGSSRSRKPRGASSGINSIPKDFIGKDYYEMLDVSRDADASEIKKAFFKRSLEFHPDKNPGNEEEAQKLFILVAEAYETLSDPEMRAKYDREGPQPRKPAADGARSYNPQDPASVLQRFDLTLEQIYAGVTLGFQVTDTILCPQCRGAQKVYRRANQPKLDSEPAPGERGPGSAISTAQSGGQVTVTTCPLCRGRGTLDAQNLIRAHISAGIPEGGQAVLNMRGDPRYPHHKPEPLILRIFSKPHARFTRRDNIHLDTTITVSWLEAAGPFTANLTHLDNRVIFIPRPSGTFDGDVVTIRGEGMPHYGRPNDKGDLRITFRVSQPSAIEAHSAMPQLGFDANFTDSEAVTDLWLWAACPKTPLLTVCRNVPRPNSTRTIHSSSSASVSEINKESSRVPTPPLDPATFAEEPAPPSPAAAIDIAVASAMEASAEPLVR